MNFLERHALMMLVEKICEESGMPLTPFNVISALDILGFINTVVAQHKMHPTDATVPPVCCCNPVGGVHAAFCPCDRISG